VLLRFSFWKSSSCTDQKLIALLFPVLLLLPQVEHCTRKHSKAGNQANHGQSSSVPRANLNRTPIQVDLSMPNFEKINATP
jgi:hypothetical protein